MDSFFDEATRLQKPDDRGHTGTVVFTEDNIEKYYPIATHTRHIMLLSNSICGDVHPGFYSIDGWQKHQEEQLRRQKEFEKHERYKKTWKYKHEQLMRRLHRAIDVLGCRDEEDY